MFEKIIVKVNTDKPNANLLTLIRKATGLGISEIKNRIIDNEPIAEYILFNNDQSDIEESLIELINQTSTLKEQLLFYDIQVNERLDDFDDISKYQITTKMLLNYFQERKSDIEGYYEKPNE